MDHRRRAGQAATAGTVMLSGLPVLAGIQFLIGFFSFDLISVPRIPLIRLLGVGTQSRGPRAAMLRPR